MNLNKINMKYLSLQEDKLILEESITDFGDEPISKLF